MIEKWNEIYQAACDLYDENTKLTDPYTPGGITGTSVGVREGSVVIIVHIHSSQAIHDIVPNSFRGFVIYKTFEYDPK